MSATGRFLYSGVSCATNAIPSSAAGDPAGLPPSTVTDPADGADRPTARFSSVLLPAPFGPTRAATCPAGTASVHSRSAHVRPYLLLRSVVSMTFMPQAYAGRRNTDITRRAVTRRGSGARSHAQGQVTGWRL